MDAVTRLLSDLVRIPSVNPMGRPISEQVMLEARMTEYLEQFFRDLGVSCVRQTIAPGRENLIARYEAPEARRTLLFDAHQDTVPTDGMTIEPFGAVIEGNRLYGRGACDIKGGMAAMLIAFARLVRERPAGSASVIMACTVDEEFTHKGSSRLEAEPPGADLGIVAEPTMLNIVNTHKGAVRWKIRAQGVACHSSKPHLGVNAIYRMARVVEALSEYASLLAGSEPDPVLGPPTLSVGRIEGGTSVNVVPDWCEIEIDRRVIPGEVPESCPSQTAEFLRDRLGSLDGLEFLPAWVNMPALRPNAPSEWLEAIGDVVQKVTGQRPEVMGVPYGTDAGPLSRSGLPCVVFGPGDIAQAHTKDEWIDLDQLRMAVDCYHEIACALG